MKGTFSKWFIILTVFIIALIFVGGSVIAKQKSTLPTNVANKIQNAVDSFIKEIEPGMTIHLQHEIYNRHGAAHFKIMELEWSVPEQTVGDIWIGPVDNNNLFIGFKSIIRDMDGNIVQQTNTDGVKKIHQDMRTGKEIISTWESTPVVDFMTFTGNIASKLLEKGWSFVAKGQWDSEETVILENIITLTPRTDDGSTFIDMPYTIDLNPVMVLLRVEIRLDNPLLQLSQRWAIDAQGTKTLVWQDRWTLIDVSN